jgi:hypothetical protein
VAVDSVAVESGLIEIGLARGIPFFRALQYSQRRGGEKLAIPADADDIGPLMIGKATWGVQL